MFMAYLHKRISERTFILLALTTCTVASFIQIYYGYCLLSGVYIASNILIVFTTQVLDGSCNGLLGKKFPDYLGVGAFNAMYISAFSTSAGRMTGNLVVSAAGDAENNAFIPLTIVSLVIVILVLIFFRVLNSNEARRKIK